MIRVAAALLAFNHAPVDPSTPRIGPDILTTVFAPARDPRATVLYRYTFTHSLPGPSTLTVPKPTLGGTVCFRAEQASSNNRRLASLGRGAASGREYNPG